MFGNSSIDSKGPPRVYDATMVRIKKSSKTKSVRYIEVSDGSSPIAVKEVKLPRASSSKAEPLEIQSNIVDISSSEASEESHAGGDVLKKRKAKSSSKPASKKQMKYAEDKKGKAVSQEVVESSDEELISGKILIGLSWSFI